MSPSSCYRVKCIQQDGLDIIQIGDSKCGSETKEDIQYQRERCRIIFVVSQSFRYWQKEEIFGLVIDMLHVRLGGFGLVQRIWLLFLIGIDCFGSIIECFGHGGV